MRHGWKEVSSVALVLGLSACVSVGTTATPPLASATLTRANGSIAGTAALHQGGRTLTLDIDAAGLPPGEHGLHLHTVGRCDPPDFASAGPHWNPSSRKHGLANPAGAHAGDLPNLTVGADGKASLRVILNPEASAAGIAGILDADGTALVVHAAPDDLRSDPSGNSGARIACGVIARR